MDVITKRIANGAVTPLKLDQRFRKGQSVFQRFDHQPSISLANGYGDPSGTAATLNRFLCSGGGLHGQYTAKGAGQTLLGPLYDETNGYLEIGQDKTDDEGVEYLFGGGLNPQNPYLYTVGTSKPSYWRLKLKIADVSGTDDCAFGLRKNEAVQANIDDYDEAAFLNVISGAVTAETILNAGATVSTDTGLTVADAGTVELELHAIGRKIYFYVNGATAPVVAPFTFDNAEVVRPFFFFLHAAVAPGALHFIEYESGLLTEIEARPN